MMDGRAAVGWRKAALASGRKKRVEFMVGSAGGVGQRAVCGSPIGVEELLWEELAYWRVVSKPGEMDCDGVVDGVRFGGEVLRWLLPSGKSRGS